MKDIKITFVGGGHMGRALIGGLIAGGTAPQNITVADPDDSQRSALEQDLEVNTNADSAAAVNGADIAVLAVKPQIMDAVLEQLAPAISARTLVISVAAGVPVERISNKLNGHERIVRVMPNTPALYRAGVTGMVAASAVDAHGRRLAEQVLGAAGHTVWVDDEALMDAVTAVSGSGPAYFFLLVECLARAGQKAGLPEQAARQLARQTAYGAGVMLNESPLDAAELRRRVTSPGGTTAAALESLHNNDFERLIEDAVEAAVNRGRELGKA
ncbi:MAG TPA: pyrroline-5-carboxylate reductase [Wenzhouxiangella sp.]|nr:pyrroline-5-carboxylate reductase [Wenzhouxiangella sp.]